MLLCTVSLPSTPHAKRPLICHCRLILSVLEFHVIGITQYVNFFSKSFKHNMRFVHVIARISSWVPFLLLSSVFDVNIAQFVYHFALDGPKSCLEFLSTLSKAPLDSGRLAFL